MKPIKETKNKLTGEEKLEEAAAELRSMANEVRSSMAKSRIAMLASIDILLSGRDLLSIDTVGALEQEKNALEGLEEEHKPEQPGEDAGEPIEQAEPVEQHDVDSKYDEQMEREVGRVEKLLDVYRPDYQRKIIEKFSEKLSEKEKDFAEEEASTKACDELINYVLNNTESRAQETKIYKQLLAQIKNKKANLQLVKIA